MTTTETTETTKTETQIVTQDPDDEVEVEAILKPIYTKEVRQAIIKRKLFPLSKPKFNP